MLFENANISCPIRCLRAGRAYWHLCATPASQWGRISPWTSTFPMGPFPSWSVISLFIVNATISSGRRSDAWSFVPRSPLDIEATPSPLTPWPLVTACGTFWPAVMQFHGWVPSGFLGECHLTWATCWLLTYHFGLMVPCVFFWLISLLSSFATKNEVRCGNLPSIFSSKDWGKETIELPCCRLVPQ